LAEPRSQIAKQSCDVLRTVTKQRRSRHDAGTLGLAGIILAIILSCFIRETGPGARKTAAALNGCTSE
jgi:hypothetical protein